MAGFGDSEDFPAGPRHIRGSGVRLLALRQHTDNHPMVMFFMIVVMAFAAAALLSPSRASIVSPGAENPQSSRASGEAPILAVPETDIACRGQAWGAESAACLAVIARESGQGEAPRIRVIAFASPDSTSPNVFR